MFKRRRLYMDFASSTPLHKEVVKELTRSASVFGNPSAPHEEGRRAKTLLEASRTRIARTLGVRPETLTYTGSGTESNNLAIVGFFEALVSRGAQYKDLHIIVSPFEHPSVLEAALGLEKRGVRLSYALANNDGIVLPSAVMREVVPETVLVSVAVVQSELGVVQPVKDLARALEEVRHERAQTVQALVPECPLPVFHTDASQAPLWLDASPERLGAHLVTYDAQKIMGPKGVGLLYKHSSVPLVSVIKGGSQERRLRAGTENVAAIAGMARAFEHAVLNRKERAVRARRLQEYFFSLLREVSGVVINGSLKERVPNNVHISVLGADGDYLAVLLDKEGVAVSPRSACIASGNPSQALLAIGASKEHARGTVRFTFGPTASRSSVQRAVRALKKALAVLGLLTRVG